MKSFGITSVLLLTLVLASPSTGEAQVLQPSELCSDHSGAAIATFEDANLQVRVRSALSVGERDDLTCGLVSGLMALNANDAGIESLVGIQNLTSLTGLRLGTNSITDISPLSGLTSLMELWLYSNEITDISALSGLTGLTELGLYGNPSLTDIQPLLGNTGLGVGDWVRLGSTNVSCADESALAARGVLTWDVCGFRWVNPLNEGVHERLSHGTFRSTSMDIEVGFIIYLPPGYDDPANAERRYPVVYSLPGGVPGNELGVLSMIRYMDYLDAVPPRIYVVVNGGGWLIYRDHEGVLAETAFVKELIPHIDANYRTIATRLGRAIEGFSSGGLGTARTVLRYPELFCSATTMAGGHWREKLFSEGRDADLSVTPARPDNTWDRASQYAARESAPELEILVVVGTEDTNHESNVAWMEHLESLGIPFESRILQGVAHNDHDAGGIISQIGAEIVTFPERCFERARLD